MFGAANGMSTLARASSVAEIFGPRHYGAISGAMALGSYERLFWLLTAALAVVSLGMFATGTEVTRQESAPSPGPAPESGR